MVTTSDERRRQVLLTEHSSIQERIGHASVDLYRTETIVPLAIAVIYAWLYGSGAGHRDFPIHLWLLPVLLAAFGAWRQCLRYTALEGYAVYLRNMEKELYGQVANGDQRKCWGVSRHWESVHPIKRFLGLRMRSHAWMRSLFWLLLISGTLALALHEMGRGRPGGGEAIGRGGSGGERQMDELRLEVAVPVIIASLSLAFAAGATAFTAWRNYVTKREELGAAHRIRLIEAAVSTANAEFATSQELLRKHDLKPRPMSAHVVFHYLLFKRLEQIGVESTAADVMRQTLHDVSGLFPVYVESGFPEFGRVFDVSIPDALERGRREEGAEA